MSETGNDTVETVRFGTLDIRFDERVLRPRAWTAEQSAWAAELLATAPVGPVLELCSGAGHIGLLAVLDSDRHLVCVDSDAVACGYAVENAAAAGLAARVEVRQAPLSDAVPSDERFAVVIADPPWVRREETGRFPDDPVTAIDGGYDGLDVARLCLDVVGAHLLAGGSALLQIGTLSQAEVLHAELPAHGPGLEVAEVRELAGGVVVRIDRPA